MGDDLTVAAFRMWYRQDPESAAAWLLRSVCRAAVRAGLAGSVAEDLVSDVAASAAMADGALSRASGDAPVAAWAVAVLRRLVLRREVGAWRDGRRMRAVLSKMEAAVPRTQYYDDVLHGPEELARLVMRLPESQREVVQMRAAGHSLDAIARLVRTSKSSVRGRLARARAAVCRLRRGAGTDAAGPEAGRPARSARRDRPPSDDRLSAQQRTLVAMWRDGLGYKAIGRRLGRDRTTVRERLRRAMKHRERGRSDGMARDWVCLIDVEDASNPRCPITGGILALRARGWSLALIARAVGLSRNAVRCRLQRLRKRHDPCRPVPR